MSLVGQLVRCSALAPIASTWSVPSNFAVASPITTPNTPAIAIASASIPTKMIGRIRALLARRSRTMSPTPIKLMTAMKIAEP